MLEKIKLEKKLLRYPNHGCLSSDLQIVNKSILDLAQLVEATLPDGPEKTTGLRKLMEAKIALLGLNIN